MGVANEPKVIAAVDLSEVSPAVAVTGARLAHRLGGGCLVVHVVEALSGEEDAGPLLPVLRRWVEGVRREAREGLARLLADPALRGYAVRGQIAEGKGHSRILEAARGPSVALVVLGGPPPSRLLGSTAERVVRRSPVPVLVVRRPPSLGYTRVLVGVDFSDGAGRALEQALALAEGGARITACHVLDTLGHPPTEEVLRAAQGVEGRVRAWTEERTGTAVDVRVEPGRPREVLLQAAKEVSADLLAVGGRGRGTLKQLLLGSVAEAAARRAPCDVLVVPSPGGGERWEEAD
ncbi:MAG: universal stress protein [Deferrisomatales bacterium]|nr:universal stress protein [Deferrisomatales bacterium]